MTVIFVSPGGGRSGGVRVTVEMANHLLLRGHDVKIACRKKPLPFVQNLKLQYRNFLKKINGIKNDDWMPLYNGKLEYYSKPEAISFKASDLLIAVGYLTVRDVYSLPDSVIKLRYCHENPCLDPDVWELPMKTIAVSETLVPLLKDRGCEVIGVVPNGINHDEYFTENIHRDGIGLVYQKSIRKGPDTALKILKRLEDANPQIKRYVFSETPEVRFTGKAVYKQYPSVEEARRIYNSSKIWLIPSRSEGFGLPILEAMACGCAVISTDHDTARGLLENGKNGILVPVDDVDAFMKAIDELLKDNELREKLVKAGQETAKKFTWERAVIAMEKILLDVNT